MDPLKVLFLAHSFPRVSGDAAGSFLLHLAVALREEGVAVEVSAPAATGYPACDSIEGIPVRRFRYAPQSWETLAYTGNMASEVQGSWRGKGAMLGYLLSGTGAAGRAMDRMQPDVVHAHWWFPGGLTALLPAAWQHRPLMTTMHGSDVRLAVGTRAAHPLMRAVLRRSSAVTCVSTWLAEQVTRVVPSVAPLVEPMPVATSLFTPPGDSPPRARLLFVGRLNTQKGIADLVAAMGAMQHVVGLDVIGDGPDRAALEESARTLGIHDRIAWHGALPQPEVVTFYQRALAVVMPGREEGLGLVAVESMLCGTPVVAYASGGTLDTVVEGVTGRLVPTGDRVALARVLDELVTNRDLCVAMGARGRERALERFSPRSVAARYAAIYRRVATRGTR